MGEVFQVFSARPSEITRELALRKNDHPCPPQIRQRQRKRPDDEKRVSSFDARNGGRQTCAGGFGATRAVAGKYNGRAVGENGPSGTEGRQWRALVSRNPFLFLGFFLVLEFLICLGWERLEVMLGFVGIVGGKGSRQRRLARCNLTTGERQDAVVVKRLEAWASRVVVDLNLCPFAAPVVAEERVRYVVCRCKDPLGVLDAIKAESDLLKVTDEKEVATTVIAVTECMQHFEAFNNFTQTLEDIFEQDEKYCDDIMPAWFHPGNQWHGTTKDDPLNYDKRAPYPVINLLRTPTVDSLIELGATSDILDNNSATLARVGIDYLRSLYAELEQIQ